MIGDRNSKSVKVSVIALIIGIGGFGIMLLLYLAYEICIFPTRISEEKTIPHVELPETGVGDYRVFVTSTTYDGNLGGLSGADAICQNLADTSSLGGRWRAWLSTNSTQARDRVNDVAYYLVNNTTKVCDDRTDLTDGTIGNIINIAENQTSIGGYVWTGTNADGTAHLNNCNNWTSNLDSSSGVYGNTNSSDGAWTNAGTEPMGGCASRYHLYCFEVIRDRDRDGYLEEIDCNDNNPAVFPGASETCNNVDDNCNGQIDENLRRQCGSDIGDCTSGTQTCNAGVWGRCVGEIGPVTEQCDGRDNDCDGSVDESLTRQCGTNEGICTMGVERCASGSWGKCSGVQPQHEVCDSLDNSCDGQVDEGCSCRSGSTQQCSKDTGECAVGTQWCEQGVWGRCLGGKSPSSEICDGRDNDCDTQVDENLTKSCGNDMGACKSGTSFCTEGVWAECTGKIDPSEEICDDLDNDCNGTVDEGCGCVLGEVRECGIDEGECQKGSQTCEGNVWSDCDGCINPKEEVCDGKDNDCDGDIDDDFVCEEAEVGEVKEEQISSTTSERGNAISDTLGNIDIAKVFIVGIVSAIATILVGVSLSKYNKLKKKKAVKRFKEGERIKPKRSSPVRKSPLG